MLGLQMRLEQVLRHKFISGILIRTPQLEFLHAAVLVLGLRIFGYHRHVV